MLDIYGLDIIVNAVCQAMQDINKQVGKRIRVIRLNRGFSQEKLASSSGLHRSHVGQIERGETNVTVKTLERIGLALRVPVVEFLKDVAPGGRSGLKS